MSDSNPPLGPPRFASFPDPAVDRAVVQSLRNLCGVTEGDFWELTNLQKMRRLIAALEPLEGVSCVRSRGQAINFAYAVVRWASQKSGTSEASIVEIVSRDFLKD
jgi:hypothetical protein